MVGVYGCLTKEENKCHSKAEQNTQQQRLCGALLNAFGILGTDILGNHNIAAHGIVAEEIGDDIIKGINLTDTGQCRTGDRTRDGNIDQTQQHGRGLLDKYGRIEPLLLLHDRRVFTYRKFEQRFELTQNTHSPLFFTTGNYLLFYTYILQKANRFKAVKN